MREREDEVSISEWDLD